MPRLEIDSDTILLFDENGVPLMTEPRSPERDRMFAQILDGAEYPLLAEVVRSVRS